MKYALNLAEDGRIFSVTYEKYAPAGAVLVDELPEGDVGDYRYVNGVYVYDPVTVETADKPSWRDQIEAQIAYTAMMTDTLLEV